MNIKLSAMSGVATTSKTIASAYRTALPTLLPVLRSIIARLECVRWPLTRPVHPWQRVAGASLVGVSRWSTERNRRVFFELHRKYLGCSLPAALTCSAASLSSCCVVFIIVFMFPPLRKTASHLVFHCKRNLFHMWKRP